MLNVTFSNKELRDIEIASEYLNISTDDFVRNAVVDLLTLVKEATSSKNTGQSKEYITDVDEELMNKIAVFLEVNEMNFGEFTKKAFEKYFETVETKK